MHAWCMQTTLLSSIMKIFVLILSEWYFLYLFMVWRQIILFTHVIKVSFSENYTHFLLNTVLVLSWKGQHGCWLIRVVRGRPWTAQVTSFSNKSEPSNTKQIWAVHCRPQTAVISPASMLSPFFSYYSEKTVFLNFNGNSPHLLFFTRVGQFDHSNPAILAWWGESIIYPLLQGLPNSWFCTLSYKSHVYQYAIKSLPKMVKSSLLNLYRKIEKVWIRSSEFEMASIQVQWQNREF